MSRVSLQDALGRVVERSVLDVYVDGTLVTRTSITKDVILPASLSSGVLLACWYVERLDPEDGLHALELVASGSAGKASACMVLDLVDLAGTKQAVLRISSANAKECQLLHQPSYQPHSLVIQAHHCRQGQTPGSEAASWRPVCRRGRADGLASACSCPCCGTPCLACKALQT